jgi:hypothetical protein
MSAPAPPTRHCVGCDSPRTGVESYTVTTTDGATTEGVPYCPECADLAAAGWAEVTAIRRTDQPERRDEP